MPGVVDYEAIKQQQQAMNHRVLQRAKEHPGKPMKLWKLLLIIGPIFLVLVALTVIALVIDL
jgi:hypothetical protein